MDVCECRHGASDPLRAMLPCSVYTAHSHFTAQQENWEKRQRLRLFLELFCISNIYLTLLNVNHEHRFTCHNGILLYI